MSFPDSIVQSVGNNLINGATGVISSTLSSVTKPFTSVIGNVQGALGNAALGALGVANSVTGGLFSDVLGIFFRGQVVAIGDLAPDCTLQEDLSDTVTVTDHPVEVGAAITDHAFLNPAEVTLHLNWSESKGFVSGLTGLGDVGTAPSPTEAYETLRSLMAARDPLDVLTVHRVYSDMLVVGLQKRTDNKSANILDITVKLRQIILVSTSTTDLKPEAQALPDVTSSIQNAGTKLVTQVKESALSSIAGVFK